MTIQLNPSLDQRALCGEFKSQRRVRIPNLLTNDSAEEILSGLESTSWHLVHSDANGGPMTYEAGVFENLSTDEQNAIHADLESRAADSYQYIYKYYPIIDAIQANKLAPTSLLYQLAVFLNGTEFLRFARDLTGVQTLVKSDPQASLYEGRHFLKQHDDMVDKSNAGDGSTRRFAFVLGFTKDWSPDWGGQTLFFDSPTRAESWNPGFNSLSIFEVPIIHSVSYVVPYAPKKRYSVTGWLRDDPKIKRPDLGDT